MDIPPEWKDVLSKVQGVFPGAIIAGGALRDLEYGKPIKDVDIFCPVVECKDGLYDDELEAILPGIELMLASLYGREANLERRIHAVYEHSTPEWKYDLVILDKVESEIDRFDLSICQISYDGSILRTSPAYQQTLADKNIYVMNINRPDRQAERIERVLQKFPDFKIVHLEATPYVPI